MPRSGVFFSWIIPMIVVMFPVNLLIFGRLLPRHVRTSTHEVGLTVAQIGRFFAADYLGALFLYGTMFLVPVLVAVRVEPHTYAYFFVAWAIASMMSLVAVNTGRRDDGGGCIRPFELGRLLPFRAYPRLGSALVSGLS